MPTYQVSTYDCADEPHKDGEWTVRYEGVSKWGLRPILRELYGEARDHSSIAVDREWFSTDPSDTPAANPAP